MAKALSTLLDRRTLLRGALFAPVAALIAACSNDSKDTAVTTRTPLPTAPAGTDSAPTARLQATPACGDDDDVTPDQTEGPFFTPDSPERTSLLESDVTGTLLVLSGTVMTTECAPVAGALLDFWQADDNGEYDNTGYRLRGHQFADDAGRYRLETIVPGLYTGRTRHIHVKVQAPNQPVLTTQLYFPDDPGNASDGIFDAALLMDVREGADGQNATFDFVLAVA